MKAKPPAKKPPVTRRGQSRPYRKATVAQHNERIELCRTLMCSGATKHTIHKTLEEQYGVVWQTTDRYMRSARELLLREAARGRDEVRSDSLGFYRRCLLDSKATVGERIKAQARIDAIYGVDAPARVQVSTPPGQPIQTEDLTKVPKIAPTKLRDMIGVLEASLAAK